MGFGYTIKTDDYDTKAPGYKKKSLEDSLFIIKILECMDYLDKYYHSPLEPVQHPENIDFYTTRFSFTNPVYTDDDGRTFVVYSEKEEEKKVEKEIEIKPTFSEWLVEYLNDKRIESADVYKKAGIDKSTFSKIINTKDYTVSKDTAICICLALELSLDDAKEALERAGYALSHSILRDVIVEFCFYDQVYELMRVNELLDRCEQKPLGRE